MYGRVLSLVKIALLLSTATMPNLLVSNILKCLRLLLHLYLRDCSLLSLLSSAIRVRPNAEWYIIPKSKPSHSTVPTAQPTPQAQRPAQKRARARAPLRSPDRFDAFSSEFGDLDSGSVAVVYLQSIEQSVDEGYTTIIQAVRRRLGPGGLCRLCGINNHT